MKRTLCAAALMLGVVFAAPAFAVEQAFPVNANISGEAPVTLAPELVHQIGEVEISTSIFVMGSEQHKVRGILLRDLMKHLGTKAENAKIAALDGYTMDVPTEDFLKYDVVLATEIDGQKLSVRDKGPAWIIYPASKHPELQDTVYEARSVWQVKSIEFN